MFFLVAASHFLSLLFQLFITFLATGTPDCFRVGLINLGPYAREYITIICLFYHAFIITLYAYPCLSSQSSGQCTLFSPTHHPVR